MPAKERPDRNLAMELVRVTESAALAAASWVGRGDKKGADGAAVDAMRNVLDTVSMDGIVVIGEGEKDEAPMLYNGERVGNGSKPLADVAVDPIDGTTLTAMGRGNALSVIAVAERGAMFNPGPCVYMEKIAVGPEAANAIDLNVSPTKNLKEVAKAMKKSLSELTVMILERDRHNDLIAEVRSTGARIRLITDGDIFAAIAQLQAKSASTSSWASAAHQKVLLQLPPSRQWVAKFLVDCIHAMTKKRKPRLRSATTSQKCSLLMTWSAAMMHSLRQPASLTASCSAVFDTTRMAHAVTAW